MATIRTLSYIPASEMFEGCPTIQAVFREDDHGNVTWGDAAHTLISLRDFLYMVRFDIQPGEYRDFDTIPAEEVNIFSARARKIDREHDRPYIDLEN